MNKYNRKVKGKLKYLEKSTQPQDFRKTILSDNGYLRYADSGILVHRDIAYIHIYLKNRDIYPMEFYRYVVHHKDGNKLNNKINNLEILTKKQHCSEHPHLLKNGENPNEKL